MICADSLKRYCYLILASKIVDYKEQVFIIIIKSNMQYFICHVSSITTKELNKNIATPDTQIHNIIAYIATKQSYQITRKSIRRLFVSAKVFCLELLPHKYSCHSIIRYCVLVIQRDYKKACGRAYKIYYKKHETKTDGKKKRHIEKLKLRHINNLTKLDKCFSNIFLFTGLKLFKHYGKIVQ